MKYSTLTQYVTKPSRAFLTLHLHPDLDSYGSNIALYHILKGHGHEVTVFSQDPVSEDLLFLSGVEEIKHQDAQNIPWEDCDVYWALDQAANTRMGPTTIPQDLTTIVIDHHDTNDDWGNVNIIEPEQASTASMILHICEELDIEITPTIAQCLMTGLAGDTGFFKFSMSPLVLKDAARLIELGAQYEDITFNILKNIQFEDIEFISKALSRAQIIKEKCFIVDIPYELWSTLGSNDSAKNEYIVDYLSRIKDTDFGALLIEEEPEVIRINLRSRNPEYNVAALAQKFNGGGHNAAAGGRVRGKPLTEVLKELIAAI